MRSMACAWGYSGIRKRKRPSVTSSKPMSSIRRRDFLFGVAATLGCLPAKAQGASSTPRVVSLDYGLAQTLIELGVPPIGLIDTTGWANWTVEPPLPPNVANLGSSHEINMELLQLLIPDLIV